MQITDITQIKSGRIPAEYTIYAYNKYCPNMIGYNKWQCLSQSKDASKVLEEAKRLFESEKFQKIEIKKKTFNEKKQRHFVSTFRIFDDHSKKNILLVLAITMITLSFGGVFVLEIL